MSISKASAGAGNGISRAPGVMEERENKQLQQL